MENLVFWLYFCNALLLINHEIDSAYWKEWELFRLPGGISGFLILHFPLLGLVLYGLVLVYTRSFAGLIFSLMLSAGGMSALAIHSYFIARGRPQFKTPVSIAILVSTGILSAGQAVATVILMVR